MDKSVYSLVLSDRIIEAADAWAAPRNLSRSAAVNRILAEYLSTTTPEQRVQDVLRQVETLLDDSLLMPTLADGLLAMRTPVRFKYNPFVRCVAEVKGSEWELRASARTQSASLPRRWIVLSHLLSGHASSSRADPHRRRTLCRPECRFPAPTAAPPPARSPDGSLCCRAP
jgi:hypothetical protein